METIMALWYRLAAAWDVFRGRGLDRELLRHRIGEGAKYDVVASVTKLGETGRELIRWEAIDAHNLAFRLMRRTKACERVTVLLCDLSEEGVKRTAAPFGAA